MHLCRHAMTPAPAENDLPARKLEFAYESSNRKKYVPHQPGVITAVPP